MSESRKKYNAAKGFLMSFEYLKGEARKEFCKALPAWIYEQIHVGGIWSFKDANMESSARLELSHTIKVPYEKMGQFEPFNVPASLENLEMGGDVLVFRFNIVMSYIIPGPNDPEVIANKPPYAIPGNFVLREKRDAEH